MSEIETIIEQVGNQAAGREVGCLSMHSERLLVAEIDRLRLFLGEIAAMGPADEEWDADTLESAVTVAKRALGQA